MRRSTGIWMFAVACILTGQTVPAEDETSPVIHVTTAAGERGEIAVSSERPHEATLSVWNLYEAGILSRSRITHVERSETTESVTELHLWNLVEPMEWSFLDSFPNLERLVISGMTFERSLLFRHGAPRVKILIIQESFGIGPVPTISLQNFPVLEEFSYYCFDAEELPLLADIPESLETVSFMLSQTLEIRSVPPSLEALAGVSEINIYPLYALPPVFRRFPQLRESMGPWDGSKRVIP